MKRIVVLSTIVTLMFAGCRPGRPLYFYDRGDLQSYIDQQVDVRYPDTEVGLLDEVTQAYPPLTIRDEEITEFWDLTLEEVVNIALKNTKTIRATGRPTQVGFDIQGTVASVIDNPDAPTIYEVGIRESEPGQMPTPGQIPSAEQLATNSTLDTNQGTEAALAEFDPHVFSSIFWNTTNRPRNFLQPGQVINGRSNDVTWETTLSKKTATGTIFSFRSGTDFNRNNNPISAFQPLRSFYTSRLEAEFNQPLLRGRGTAVNRAPVVVARIGGDQTVANTEFFLQNMLTQLELAYWELQGAYRQFEVAKESVENAAKEYERIQNLNFQKTDKDYARVIAVYYQYVANLNTAYGELQRRENDLRFMMGLSSNDGSFIRPTDEPVTTELNFDWYESINEALLRRPNLRIKQWEIKKKEIGINYAKNGLLAQLNFVALYRFLGVGNNLFGATAPFPGVTSGSTNNLYGGSSQEVRLAIQGGYTIGQRREMMNVRNAQLKLARERSRLEDMELDVARELQNAFNAMVYHYEQAKVHANRWAALKKKIDTVKANQSITSTEQEIEQLYIDQQNAADAQIAFHNSIYRYNQFIALIHRLKGSALEYYNVQFGEGPWPEKAYYDARELARKRGASAPINYGFTRPGTVSAGTDPTFEGGRAADILNSIPSNGYNGGIDAPIEGEIIEGPIELSPPQIEGLPAPNNVSQVSGQSLDRVAATSSSRKSWMPSKADFRQPAPSSGSRERKVLQASFSEQVDSQPSRSDEPVQFHRLGLGNGSGGQHRTQAKLKQIE